VYKDSPPLKGKDTDNDHEMSCVLGACFVERSMENDYVIPQSEYACKDLRSDCKERAVECESNKLIHASCSRTCNDCHDRIRIISIVRDDETTTTPNKTHNELLSQIPRGSRRDNILEESVSADFGVLQFIPKQDSEFQKRADIIDRAFQVLEYMEQLPMISKSVCRNENSMCMLWAVSGECDANPNYMNEKCGPACFRCEYEVGSHLSSFAP